MKTQDENNEVPKLQQGEDWLSWRKIGSSDTPKILGISPYGNRLDCYNEKMGISKRPESSSMSKGKKFEPHIRALMEKKLGVSLEPCCVYNPTYTHMTASLDGLDMDRNIFVEIKYNNAVNHEMAAAGTIVDHHLAQMVHQWIVLGNPNAIGIYGSYNEKEDNFVVNRAIIDQKMVETIIEETRKFWDCLVNKIPPEPAKEELIIMDDEKMLNLACEIAMTKQERKRAERVVSDLKEEEDALKFQLASMTGERNAKLGHYEFKKIVRQGSIEYKKIPQLEGIDLEPYRKKSSEYWDLT